MELPLLTLGCFSDSLDIDVIEQRRSQRFELRLPLELVRSVSEPESRQGETRNLSSAGVLFKTEARLQVGEPVEYLITLPTSSDHKAALRLRCVGKVVRFARESEIAATLERYEFVRNGQ